MGPCHDMHTPPPPPPYRWTCPHNLLSLQKAGHTLCCDCSEGGVPCIPGPACCCPQEAVHAAWRARKARLRSQSPIPQSDSSHAIPEWFRQCLQLRTALNDEDFGNWYQNRKGSLAGCSSDLVSLKYLRQVEAELQSFR